MKILFCALMVLTLSACAINNKQITYIEFNQYFDVYYDMDDYLLEEDK